MVAFINAIPQAGTDNRGPDEKTPSTYKGQRRDFGQEVAGNLWRKAALLNAPDSGGDITRNRRQVARWASGPV
jgi:hypothetical protein